MKYFITIAILLLSNISVSSEKIEQAEQSDFIDSSTPLIDQNDSTRFKILFDEKELAWLRVHKKVRIGSSQYPPLTFFDNSKSLSGISADYLKLISERTGIVFDAQYFAWPELMQNAKTRKIDLFSGLKNPDRESYLNFTGPYLQVSYVVINRIETSFLGNFSNLNGHNVAVVENWKVHKLLRTEYPQVNIIHFETVPQALTAVSTRRADAYVGDLLTASFQIQKNVLSNLKIAAPAPFPDDAVRFAVRKDWPELLSILDKVINSLTYDENDIILRHWLQVRFEKGVDWLLVWWWTGSVGGILCLIIVLAVFWNRLLSKEIRNRKKVEKKLIFASEKANLANNAKNTFLAKMSHELRTPLNSILGFSHILGRQENLTNMQKSQIQTIHASGKHLLTLLNDILDMSRLEAHKQELKVEAFNLPALVSEVLSIFQVKATEKELAFHYANRTKLPAIIRSDPGKLKQVLINLLDNAIKYTDEGSVTLRAEPMRSESLSFESQYQKETIRFEIEDTGIGIPRGKQEEIFKPFTQLDIEGRKGDGTGLGLAISHSLVELMGGRLWVESLVGKGSTFALELGFEVVKETAKDVIKASEKIVFGYEGERKGILVVDDNSANLEMLLAFLEPLGFELETAVNGEEAIARAELNRPDLILMDLLMPGINGHQALQKIRQNNTLRKTKIVGVSAAIPTSPDKSQFEAFTADCDDFVSKPVDMEALLLVLKEQLQIKWTTQSVEITEICAEEAAPAKMPPQIVLDKIVEKVEAGDFSGLNTFLDSLGNEDQAYAVFCNQIRTFSKQYDDKAIFKYIAS